MLWCTGNVGHDGPPAPLTQHDVVDLDVDALAHHVALPGLLSFFCSMDSKMILRHDMCEWAPIYTHTKLCVLLISSACNSLFALLPNVRLGSSCNAVTCAGARNILVPNVHHVIEASQF